MDQTEPTVETTEEVVETPTIETPTEEVTPEVVTETEEATPVAE